MTIVMTCLLGSVLLEKDAQAYWTSNNGEQCFSVKYEDTTVRNNPVTGNVGGTTTTKTAENAISTYQICATVDSSGKVKGALERRAKPKYTSNTGMPDLSLNKSKNAVILTYCRDTSKSSCPREELQNSQTFEVSNYATFEQLAQAVTNAAQANYKNDKNIAKAALKDNDTQKELHEQAVKQDSEKAKEAAENSPANKCNASGGALSLGWVVCPIMEWLSDAADNIYNEYVEPSLQIEPQLFTNGNSSTWDAWSTFRDFANIAFVILFLFVIFSQLTGVGIDNYGIKKALPKLIVAAVLINLSYVICELAVDVSNILGNSFQALFTELGNNLYLQPLNLDGETVDLMSKEGIATGLSAVGLLSLLGGGTFAILANPAIMLSMLVSALGIAIALFFLFILLSMREAAVVVLIVIAPLAFVAYILPNTKKLFDRWLSFFKGLLIVYPVCGLLVGGGNYVSRLLLAANVGNGSFLTAFTAMMVGVLPIFFIPMVIRSAFNAMGTIGSRLAGLGGRLGDRTTGMARGSQAYRNAQELGAERANRIRAGVDANGKAYDVGRLGTLLRGGRRNVARARSQYLSNQDARNREENLMGSGYDAAMAGIEDRANQQKIADFEALMASGKVIGADGKSVNTNDPSSVAAFHANALGRYNNAKTDAEREAAMVQVHGAQNMLMKTTAGRDSMQSNLEAYARASQASGLSDDERKTREEGLRKASSHIMGQFGDKLKATNRGSHAMIQDMASGASMSDVVNKINDSTYDMTGTSKYTSETLAAADDGAVDRIINNMGNMSPEQAADIQSSASNALRQEAAGEISLKPEMRRKMQAIVGATVRSAPPAP